MTQVSQKIRAIMNREIERAEDDDETSTFVVWLMGLRDELVNAALYEDVDKEA